MRFANQSDMDVRFIIATVALFALCFLIGSALDWAAKEHKRGL